MKGNATPPGPCVDLPTPAVHLTAMQAAAGPAGGECFCQEQI